MAVNSSIEHQMELLYCAAAGIPSPSNNITQYNRRHHQVTIGVNAQRPSKDVNSQEQYTPNCLPFFGGYLHRAQHLASYPPQVPSYLCLQPVNTNVLRSAANLRHRQSQPRLILPQQKHLPRSILCRTAPSIVDQPNWQAGPMSGIHDENRPKYWKLESTDDYHPVQDITDWDCPNLISGSDEETSPAETMSSWASLAAQSNVENYKVATSTESLKAGPSSSEYIHSETPHHAQNTMATATPLPVHYDQFVSGFDYPTYPRSWDWSPASTLTDTTEISYWASSSTASQQALPSTALPSNFNVFPAFGSDHTSEQMGAAYPMPSEFSIAPQQQHIVPGLLSTNFLDDTTMHAASVPEYLVNDFVGNIVDSMNTIRAVSEASSVVPDRHSNPDQDSLSGHQRTPSPVGEEDVLASQSDDGSGLLVRSNGLTSQRRQILSQEERVDRDMFIIQSRRNGLSYKEIKRRGGFDEAESTLRGRVRNLTKPKDKRVRKPVWHHNDINILRNAIAFFTRGPLGGTNAVSPQALRAANRMATGPKTPWKKVAEWMAAHGASYPFAPATCAKKWEQLQDTP